MRRTAVFLSFAVACMLLVHCGFEPLAGGSGAGNPGNTAVSSAEVEFSMVAVGGQVQAGPYPPAKLSNGSLLDSTGSITVTDARGLRLTLTEVVLSNVEPRFMLDTALRPDSLLSHMTDPSSGLSCDSNSIMLDGLHAFDAVDGKFDSSDGRLRLPVARYSGVAIGFQEYQSGYQYPPPPPPCSRIFMKGSFLYGDAMHGIMIEIHYSPQSCRQNYWFGGGIFTLSALDTTHLELQLDAKRWFARVDFAGALANGSLNFDGAGVLNISDPAVNPVVWGIQSTIAADFFASGKLVVY
ncbi:MAG: hypothetical protein JW699_04890 [Chitinispirillaceae bacterium]|nr:hypothetical protein [Chitinispirillaceae bacterium]